MTSNSTAAAAAEAGGVAPQLTTHDGLAYLNAVKDTFKDDQDKYDRFLKVMKDFKAKRIDTAGLVSRVKELFRGHKALLLGFNAFVPEGYQIVIHANEEELMKKKLMDFDKAVNYVSKVQTHLQSDHHVYNAFLGILSLYRNGNKSIQEVYQELMHLLTGHPDLLEDLTYFFPDSIINRRYRRPPCRFGCWL